MPRHPIDHPNPTPLEVERHLTGLIRKLSRELRRGLLLAHLDISESDDDVSFSIEEDYTLFAVARASRSELMNWSYSDLAAEIERLNPRTACNFLESALSTRLFGNWSVSESGMPPPRRWAYRPAYYHLGYAEDPLLSPRANYRVVSTIPMTAERMCFEYFVPPKFLASVVALDIDDFPDRMVDLLRAIRPALAQAGHFETGVSASSPAGSNWPAKLVRKHWTRDIKSDAAQNLYDSLRPQIPTETWLGVFCRTDKVDGTNRFRATAVIGTSRFRNKPGDYRNAVAAVSLERRSKSAKRGDHLAESLASRLIEAHVQLQKRVAPAE